MDLSLAIAINRMALARIVAGLVVVLGGVGVLTRRDHSAVLDVLRPAEAAMRRLIAILAHGLIVPLRSGRAAPVDAIPRGTGARGSVFRLFDPRRRVGPIRRRVPGRGPGVWSLDGPPPPAQDAPPLPGDPVDAGRVERRLAALQRALDDPAAQARRLAGMLARGRSKFLRVMRPGRPPGHRTRWRHPVDEILSDCHDFALEVLHRPARDGPFAVV